MGWPQANGEKSWRIPHVVGRWMLNAFLPALLGVLLLGIHYADWVRIIVGEIPYVAMCEYIFHCFDPARIAESAMQTMQTVFGIAVLALCPLIAIKRSQQRLRQSRVEKNQ